MDVDQYLSNRSNLIARVLTEHPFSRDWRSYAVGGLCLTGALAAEMWAAHTIVDPGFFARTSMFMICLLVSGVWLLSLAFGADVLIARTAVPAREAVLEETLSQMLKIDGSIVHDLISITTK